MRKGVWFLAILCCLLSVTPVGAAQTEPDGPAQPLELSGVDAGLVAAKESAPPRLQGELDQLAEAYRQRGVSGLQQAAEERNVPLRGDRVLVVVEGDVSRLPAGLAKLGGEIDSVARDRLSVLAPAPALRDMAALAGVQYVRLPLPAVAAAMPQAGSYTTEGLGLLDADDWQAAGYSGTGVKAAIVDFGFYNWTGLQASGELPTGTRTVCRDFTGGSDCGNTDPNNAHGSACAEILYDMAPGIDTLYLYAFDDDADIAVIVDDMIANGVTVASLSISWVNGEPYDGSGPISAEITRARNDGDIFWAVAAGNGRRRHWEGSFVDNNNNRWHDFDPATGNLLDILAYDGSSHQISGPFVASLTWDRWPVTDQDYDLYLLRWLGGTWRVYASSTALQNGDDPPTELISQANLPLGQYALAVYAYNQSGPAEYLELVTFYQDQDSRYRVESSSVIEPATADGAVAVAAYNWATPQSLEVFGAMGPRNPAGGGPFDANACGTTPTADCKPDFAGPNWVSTVSYGSQAFGGTSAAAPHIAGAAALLQGAHPAWTSGQVYNYLVEHVVEPAPPTGDKKRDWGWGSSALGNPPHITAVEVTGFVAQPVEQAIQLQWETATEIDTLGFSLYRGDTPGGEFVPLNDTLIPGQAPGSPTGALYGWLDSGVETGQTYYYRLEAVDLHGQSTFYGPVAAALAPPARHRAYLPMVFR